MKTKLRPRRFGRFLRAREAVSALEYAILVGVVAVAIGLAIVTFSGDLTTAIEGIGDNVTTSVAGTGVGTIPGGGGTTGGGGGATGGGGGATGG